MGTGHVDSLTCPLYIMPTSDYLLASILGVLLAYVCIMGWRRLIPCFLIGFCLANAPQAALAQYSFDPDADVPAINEVRDAVSTADYNNTSYLYNIEQMLYYLDQDNDHDNLQLIHGDLQTVATYTQYLQSAVNQLPYDITQYLETDFSALKSKLDLIKQEFNGLDQDNDADQLQAIRDELLNIKLELYGLDQDNDVPVLNDIEEILVDMEGVQGVISQNIVTIKDKVINMDSNLLAMRNTIDNAFAPGTVEATPSVDDLAEVNNPNDLNDNDAVPDDDDAPDVVGDIEGALGDGAYKEDFTNKFKPNNFVTVPTDNPPLPTAGVFNLGGGGMFSVVADITTPMVSLFNEHSHIIKAILTSIICMIIVVATINAGWRMSAS